LKLRSGRSLAIAAWVCVWLAGLPGVASAQSLRDLYEAARSFDGSYLAALANARAAEFRAAQSDALNRPTLGAVAGANVTLTDPPNISAKTTSSLSAILNSRYPLFNRVNAVTIEQARKSLVSVQADLDTAEQDLILRVSQAYFDVLAAQDTLSTTQASKKFITEQLASAKRNFEVGTATITDTREAQARFDLATAQELAADNELRSRRINLETLVGRQGVTPKTLLLPAALPAVVPANPEQWATEADQRHPTVRRARVAMDLAQLETAKARAAEMPTVDAVANVGASDARGSLPSLTRSTGSSLSAGVGVQMNWQLYTGGLTQNRIKETLALEEKARNDLEAARRGIGQTARVAYFNLQSSLAQVKALEAAESSSKLALEATQLGFRVGVRVNRDVLNAQSQLFTTQRDLARARYEVVLGGLRLRQASGQLAPSDVEAINRLLTP
jgi:outer membrane protein